MSQGLVTKIVRNVKPFIYHKDASVQVTALIVLGCVVASEPIIPETKEILFKKNLNIEGNTYVTDSNPEENGKNDDESIVYAEFSDDEDECVEDESVPWLLKRCLSNLGVQFTPIEVKYTQFIYK
uniref:HEAT repeat-containing protein 6-like n=1 Tax=Diabrotica virgifera virgifera TaxID=50390 RepID=A0A6P7H3W3_DIAVI